MPEQEDSRGLTDMYVERIRSDLARVEAEAEQARARLEQLGKDRAWLLDLLSHLPADLESSEPAADADASESEVMADRTSVAAGPTAAPAAATTSRRPASGPSLAVAAPSGAGRRRSHGGPTLRELVVRHLAAQDGPTTVLEATTTVNNTGQVRRASTVVVRNTLEVLVAQGIARRSKQGRSVYYTLLPGTSTED